MKPPERVVFDCNVFFQAFLSELGPAGQLLLAVHDETLSAEQGLHVRAHLSAATGTLNQPGILRLGVGGTFLSLALW